ncbi:MAG: multicopper oxidase domain-containing protein [Terriglobales bacterium]
MSRNGRLQVTLTLRNSLDSYGRMHYCYIDEHGDRSPTLRVRPGDLLLLKLKNELSLSAHGGQQNAAQPDCKSSAMSAMAIDATNLHFHGLTASPVCPADDSLHISVAPSKFFLYRVHIPEDEHPGLYWYHPHPHGHTEEQVLGGASGALIVEGITRANPVTAGLPARVLVIRDQKLRDWKVAALKGASQKPDPNRPSKDLSINFIPVSYPEYPLATIETHPRTRELWRVLNASADTYVNLGVLFNGELEGSKLVAEHASWQPLGLVSLDGVPIPEVESSKEHVLWKTSLPIPPGGRAEFIFDTPPEGIKAQLITGGVDTNPPDDEDNPRPPSGPGSSIRDVDDYTPPRPLARIAASPVASEPPALDEAQPAPAPPAANTLAMAPLATVSPVRQRKLYFSEKVMDPRHPETSTVFYITEEGHTPKAFDPAVLTPDVVVHQGDIEDWTIENRSTESHAFHIHQLHFLPLERDHEPVSEGDLLDTVDVPYWDGVSKEFPSVKLRMDFRGADIVGVFPYHCHILQHVDGGMMGLIEVKPKLRSVNTRKTGANSR